MRTSADSKLGERVLVLVSIPDGLVACCRWSGFSEMCTAYKLPNQDWLYNSVNQFSAACWHFAEHLTDIAEANNETVSSHALR